MIKAPVPNYLQKIFWIKSLDSPVKKSTLLVCLHVATPKASIGPRTKGIEIIGGRSRSSLIAFDVLPADRMRLGRASVRKLARKLHPAGKMQLSSRRTAKSSFENSL